MTFGIEPRLAMPMLAQAVQSMATPRDGRRAAQVGDALAEQVVRRRVVRLTGVAEAPGDRGEDDRGVERGRSPSACSRWNQPSALTSNTRSYSRCGLSGRKWLMSSPAQWISTSTRPLRSAVGQRPRRRPRPGRSGRPGASARCRRPADRLDRVQRRARPARSGRARARPASASAGRRAALMRSARSCLRPSRSVAKRVEVRVAGSGSGTRSSRWKVPPAAAARSAVIADTMLPAAPVTRNTVSSTARAPGRGSASALDQADAPAQIVGVADLDGARVAQRLVEQRSASAAVLRSAAKSTP